MKKRLLLLTLSLLSLDTFAAESAKSLHKGCSRIVTPKQLPQLPCSEEIEASRMAGTLFAAKYDFSPSRENRKRETTLSKIREYQESVVDLIEENLRIKRNINPDGSSLPLTN